MPKSYEEAVEETQESLSQDEEHMRGLVNRAIEQGMEFDGETLEEKFKELIDISVVPPDYLSGGDTETPFDPTDPPEIPDPSIDLGQIEAILQSGNQAQILGAMGRILLGIFSLTADIADDMSPSTRITVSGTNAITQADRAEPIVPESDNELIPTRWLFVKSSADNSHPIAIGDDDADPDSGFVLNPGDSIKLEADLRREEYYMACSESGEEVQLLGGF